MKISFEKKSEVSIIRLEEKKLDTSNSGLLKGEIVQIIEQNDIRNLIFNLLAVEQCDSSGLSSLLVANRVMQARKGNLRFIPSEKVLALIKVTKLDRILLYNKSEDAAEKELLG
ncbi:MAG: STAS domain-containing protein [Ignavibacteriales bacterium]|nr:STAS domain-containing protein [Ignavibacteriales bacterium]